MGKDAIKHRTYLPSQTAYSEVKEIVFATNNAHKLEEARDILSGRFIVRSLSDIGCQDEIPETADTLEGNAKIKARWIKEKYGYDCFADDTGLMVDALDGAPGVYSARFAGPECDSRANTTLLLHLMNGKTRRSAHFSTVIALILDGVEHIFTGSVEGEIAISPRGEAGFGYDPVFIPEHMGCTFAEMTEAEKNALSHRGRALRAMADFIAD